MTVRLVRRGQASRPDHKDVRPAAKRLRIPQGQQRIRRLAGLDHRNRDLEMEIIGQAGRLARHGEPQVARSRRRHGER